MKTIKCKITNEVDVSEYLRKYNSVLRISYNCLKDRFSQSNIKKLVNPKFEGLNCFIIQNAIVQAQGILNSFETRKAEFEKKNPGKKMKEIFFGGRKNFADYNKGKITKEEYKNRRLAPMTFSGETRHNGNRMFDLDIEHNTVVFKPKRKVKISIEFTCSNKQKDELLKVQELCLKKDFAVAISLNNNYISFCFDEERINKEQFYFKDLKENRVLGIDQNPNYLGISVIEFAEDNSFKVLRKQVFDLTQLTKKPNSSKASNKIANKRKFETLNIAYEVDKLIKSWKCKKLVIEDLKFKNKLKGKTRNRLCKNSWNRCLFENKLKMLAKLHGYEAVEINPCYTSQIGNILYGNETTPDMIAASIEIARRGFKKYQKSWFYPCFSKSLNLMNEQWKQTSSDNFVKEWKDLFKLIKESELKYRISLDGCKPSEVLSLNCKRSKTSILLFKSMV